MSHTDRHVTGSEPAERRAPQTGLRPPTHPPEPPPVPNPPAPATDATRDEPRPSRVAGTPALSWFAGADVLGSKGTAPSPLLGRRSRLRGAPAAGSFGGPRSAGRRARGNDDGKRRLRSDVVALRRHALRVRASEPRSGCPRLSSSARTSMGSSTSNRPRMRSTAQSSGLRLAWRSASG